MHKFQLFKVASPAEQYEVRQDSRAIYAQVLESHTIRSCPDVPVNLVIEQQFRSDPTPFQPELYR